jgi:hypothetical protein
VVITGVGRSELPASEDLCSRKLGGESVTP